MLESQLRSLLALQHRREPLDIRGQSERVQVLEVRPLPSVEVRHVVREAWWFRNAGTEREEEPVTSRAPLIARQALLAGDRMPRRNGYRYEVAVVHSSVFISLRLEVIVGRREARGKAAPAAPSAFAMGHLR